MLCTHCTLVGITLIFIYVQSTEAYSKSSQTSKMELSCKKIVSGWKPLSIFAKSSKSSMSGAWLNSKYTSRLFSLQLPSLREKCPYSELFWSAFSRIRTEYGEILRISPYSVRMRENMDQNKSEYGHFLHCAYYSWIVQAVAHSPVNSKVAGLFAGSAYSVYDL